jgi:chaperonin cofactor prefoldin
MKANDENLTETGSVPDLAKTALDAIKASKERINLEIENLSAQIVDLEKEKQKSKNGLISIQDYSDFLREEIKKRSANYASLWLGSRHSVKPGGRAQKHSDMRWPDFIESEVGTLLSGVLTPDTTSDALCFLFPELMHERLMACLRESGASKWSQAEDIGIAKRRDELNTIEGQIAEVTTQRDSLFRQLNEIKNALQTS